MNRLVFNVLVVLLLLVAGAAAAVGVFAVSALPNGARNISALENINGVPYPMSDGATVVTESLAHADLYVGEPVFGHDVRLTVTFDPGNLQRLTVGVRDNQFWLSYPPVLLYDADVSAEPGQQHVSVQIPLTDKLAAADNSVDVMFMATPKDGVTDIADRVPDTTLWRSYGVTATVVPAQLSWNDVGSWWQAGDFLISALKRERPI